MNGYQLEGVADALTLAALLAGTLLAGLLIRGLRSVKLARLFAWALAVGSTVAANEIFRAEPAGLRMLALIGALLYGMKAVVTVEYRADGGAPLAWWQWLAFAAGWPGMRPGIFVSLGQKAKADSWRMVHFGLVRFAAGAVLMGLAWFTWHSGRAILDEMPARIVATIFLLPGLSLMLHFGVFNILAGLWRLGGVDARPLFRSPLAARTLGEFWGKRWNLAFSEMTAIGVYRPLASVLGRTRALVAGFVFSGLLHELAISVPVRAGYGLPMTYFALHGALVLLERRLEGTRYSPASWGAGAHVWVVGWLAVPLPILFHRPFLAGCVWPLIGME